MAQLITFSPQEKQAVNDLDDFKMPARLYGKTDLELMINGYHKLSNQSHGLTVRFNYGQTAKFDI